MPLTRDVTVSCTTIGCPQAGQEKTVSAVYLGNRVYQRLEPICGDCNQAMQVPATVDDERL